MTRIPLRRRFPTPALDAWLAEMRWGKRTMRATDPLWQAACWDIAALEAHGRGEYAAADRLRKRAIEIIGAAARQSNP